MKKKIKIKKFLQSWNGKSKQAIEDGIATKEMGDNMLGAYASLNTAPLLTMLFDDEAICDAVVVETEDSFHVHLEKLDVKGDSVDNTIKIDIEQNELDRYQERVFEDLESYDYVFTVEHHKSILEQAIKEAEVHQNFEDVVVIENTTVVGLMEGFIKGQEPMKERYSEEELELFLKDEGAILSEFKNAIDVMSKVDHEFADCDEISVKLQEDKDNDIIRMVLSFEGEVVQSSDLTRKEYLRQLVDLAFILDVHPVEVMQANGYSWEDFKFYFRESVKAMALEEVA